MNLSMTSMNTTEDTAGTTNSIILTHQEYPGFTGMHTRNPTSKNQEATTILIRKASLEHLDDEDETTTRKALTATTIVPTPSGRGVSISGI